VCKAERECVHACVCGKYAPVYVSVCGVYDRVCDSEKVRASVYVRACIWCACVVCGK